MDRIVIQDPEYNNIYWHHSSVKEFEKLYAKNPTDRKAYLRWFNRRLDFLNKLGDEVFLRFPDVFEKRVGGKEDIYMICRREFNGNPRMLFFSIKKSDDKTEYYLLHAFKELSRGSYDCAFPVAEARIKEIRAIENE